MPRVLLVDDDPDIRAWVLGVLEEFGYTVDVLPSDEGVLRVMNLGIIDLALIDYHMPDKSGLTLLRDIRAAKISTPVVMLTADNSQQLAVECFRAGAVDFITKPIDADYLNIVIERTLNAKSTSLKNTAYRSMGYMQHKPECSFHDDTGTCDCGLKDIFESIQDF